MQAKLDRELSRAVIALTDEIPDDAKIAGLDHYYVSEPSKPEAILIRLASGADSMLAGLAVYAAADRYGTDLRDLSISDDLDHTVTLAIVRDEAGSLLAEHSLRRGGN